MVETQPTFAHTNPEQTSSVHTGWYAGRQLLLERLTPKHNDWRDVAEEAIGMTATVGRYALTALPMARRARNGESILGYGIATVVGDVADGEITRSVSKALFQREAEDTPLRRIADGLLDQVTIFQVGYEVAKRNKSSRPYLTALGMRSVIVGVGLNTTHLLATGEVTKGKKMQKATSLTSAVFGIAAASGNRAATHITGTVAVLTAWATMPKHLQGFREQRGRVFREIT